MKLKPKEKYIHKEQGYEVKILNQVANKVTYKDHNGKHKMIVEQFLAEFEEPFKPVFKGYMKMYLGGDTAEGLFKKKVCAGDWLTKPQQILGKHKKDKFKGRKFQVNFYLFDTAENKGHEIARILDRVNIETLVSAVAELGNELASHAEKPIDISESYAVIKA